MRFYKNLTIIALLSLILMISVISGLSFSWLPGAEITDPTVSASVLTNYFEAGEGTEAYPFIIHSPRHLYNLAWLQYNGYFNQLDEGGNLKQYYFKLCDGAWTYKNGSTATCGGIEDDVLDMTGWVLPPIGNQEYPFIGHFGCFVQGASGTETTDRIITIKNLHVSGLYSHLSDPALEEDQFEDYGAYVAGDEGCDIVGLFGVVGTIDGTAGTIGGKNYTVSANSVHNFKVENLTVTSGTEHTLSGIIAGYANGAKDTLKHVQILSESNGTTRCILNAMDADGLTPCTYLTSSLTQNVSDYGSIGYCSEVMTEALESTDTDIFAPTAKSENTSSTQGAGNAWGGSLDITSLYNRIDTGVGSGSGSTYMYQITGATKNLDGTIDTSTGTDPRNNTYYHVSPAQSVSYTLSPGQFGSGLITKYLSGGLHVINGTVIEALNTDGYIISTGTNYMNLGFEIPPGGTSKQPVITNGTVTAQATKWVFENDGETVKTGKLYAIKDQTQYYVRAAGADLSVTTVKTDATNWTMTVSQTGTGLSGNLQSSEGLFIFYDTQKWCLSGNTLIAADLGSDVKKYLGITSSGVVGELQTPWFFTKVGTDPNAAWKVYGYYGGQAKYLAVGNAASDLELLSLTNESGATLWKKDSEGNLVYDKQISSSVTRRYIISYQNGWKLAYTEYLRIAEKGENGHILGVTGTTSPQLTNAENCRWVDDDITDDSSRKTLYTVWNGTKYYLYCEGKTLKLDPSHPTVWTDSGSGLFVDTTSYGRLYLQYIGNQWTLVRCCTVTDTDGTILGASGGTLNNTAATVWTFTDPDLDGTYICCIDGTAVWYLNMTSASTVALQTSASTLWTVGSDGSIKGTYNGTRYHLYYYNGWKTGAVYENCKIIRGYTSTANLKVNGNISSGSKMTNSENRYEATRWQVTESGSSVVIKVYDNTNLKIGRSGNWITGYNMVLTSGSDSSWNLQTVSDSKRVYHSHNSIDYYIGYGEYTKRWQISSSSTTDGRTLYFLDYYAGFDLAEQSGPSVEIQTVTRGTGFGGKEEAMSALTLTKSRVRDIQKSTGREFWDYNRVNVTCIPLSMNSSSQVKSDNTGYVLGGSRNQESESGSFPERSGDIRITKRTRSLLTPIISEEYIGNTSWSITTRYVKKALTIGKQGQDSVGSSKYPTSMFQRYSSTDGEGNEKGAKPDFETIMHADWSFYGIHFMEAKIDLNNLIPLSEAVIEKATYKNYEMPASSVDFQLMSRGFITFFAGTYYSGNTAFFSLYHIKREKDKFTTAGSAVLAIYESDSSRIFKCNDGEFYTWNSSSGRLERTSIGGSFETEYQQINTNTYLYLNSEGQPLIDAAHPEIYQNSYGYFTYDPGTGTKATVSELPVDYTDANKISSINEIRKIFGVYDKDDATKIDDSKEFIYRYTNGEHSRSIVSSTENTVTIADSSGNMILYELVFDTQWLTDPVSVVGSSFNSSDGLYYFEIPANAGEYALGSVSKKAGETAAKNGAYLLYLDIAANASSVRTQTITEIQQITQQSYRYPVGTQFRAKNMTAAFNSADSVAFALENGGALTSARIVNAARDCVECTYTGTLSSFVPGFIGDETSVKCGSITYAAATPEYTAVNVRERVIENQNQGGDLVITNEQKVTVTVDRTVGTATTRTMYVTENGETYSVTPDTHAITVPSQEKAVLKTHSDLYTPLNNHVLPMEHTSACHYTVAQSDGLLLRYDQITVTMRSVIENSKLTVLKRDPSVITSPSVVMVEGVYQYFLNPEPTDGKITPIHVTSETNLNTN